MRYFLLALLISSSFNASAFAGTFFNDSFTEDADTSLALHPPDTGAGWTRLINNGVTLRADASTDDCRRNAGVGTDSAGVLYTADLAGSYPSPDYEIVATYTNLDNGDDISILALRIQDANNMYGLRFNTATTRIYECNAGVWTAIGAALGGIASGSVIRFGVSGNTLYLYDDGAIIDSVVDTVAPITASGKAGIGYGNIITATDDADISTSTDFTVRYRRIIVTD
ncbi:MAG: hypothetical protein HQL30_11935 [Candidatus Omnitrophica bacterium]|nr:hypothetical protein [Candidatus Omnitrophota bacterium]